MIDRQRLEDKARWSDFWEELQAKGPKGTLDRAYSTSEVGEYWSTRIKHLLGCEGIVTLTAVSNAAIDLVEEEAYRIIADYNLVPTANRKSGIEVHVIDSGDNHTFAHTGSFVNLGLSAKIEFTLTNEGTVMEGARRVTEFFSHNCHSGYKNIPREFLRTFANMTAALLVEHGLREARGTSDDDPKIVSIPIDIVVADVAAQLYCALGTQGMKDYDATRKYLWTRPSMLTSEEFTSQAMQEWYRILNAAIAQLKEKVKLHPAPVTG